MLFLHALFFFLFSTLVISVPVGSKAGRSPKGIAIDTLNTVASGRIPPLDLPLAAHGFWIPLSGHNSEILAAQPNNVLRIGPYDKVSQADRGPVELWELPGGSPGPLTLKEVIRDRSQFQSLHDTVWIWFPTEYDVAGRRKSLAYVRIKGNRFVIKVVELEIEEISRKTVSSVSLHSEALDYWYRPDSPNKKKKDSTDQVMQIRESEGKVMLWKFAAGSTPGVLQKYMPGDLEKSYINIGEKCADIADEWMPYPTTNLQNRDKVLLVQNAHGGCQTDLITWRAKVTWK
ncbi:hypothetical protein F5887DRAFT_599848 [Amanita rubescens]|nr:hypothetical protein F5887DRAFT_599848 [Amanita rubescens]